MGFYQHWIVPRLIDLAMRNRRLNALRQRTIVTASGVVLEVGMGSGQNLPLYRSAVDRVYAIDPSVELLHMARRRIANPSVPVSLIRASAEQLPFADAIFDTITMTWTLCSIPNPVRALIEMRRVLKPGGNLAFVEHGLSPEAGVAHWQRRLTPYWKRFGGGCHLDRKMDDLIRTVGFEPREIETGYMAGPKLMTFMYQGRASP
jgi:ubiquinone/menaquinone biosynthesis C-methylase UbiE